MAKEVVNIDNYQSGEPQRKIKVFTTDDGVRYIFEHLRNDVEMSFSHRYYPNRPRGKRRDGSNYRLPEAVKEAAEARITPYDLQYKDGMIKEAQLNQTSVAKFSQNHRCAET